MMCKMVSFRTPAFQILLKEKKIKSLVEVTDRHDYTPLHIAAQFLFRVEF